MSGRAHREYQQLKLADDHPDVDVPPERLTDATSDALREHATELDQLRRTGPDCIDPALADTSRALRTIADALNQGITDPTMLNEYLHDEQYHTVAESVASYHRHDDKESDES